MLCVCVAHNNDVRVHAAGGSTDLDDDSSGASSSGRIATAVAVVMDPMGYYEILGIKPAIEVGGEGLDDEV